MDIFSIIVGCVGTLLVILVAGVVHIYNGMVSAKSDIEDTQRTLIDVESNIRYTIDDTNRYISNQGEDFDKKMYIQSRDVADRFNEVNKSIDEVYSHFTEREDKLYSNIDSRFDKLESKLMSKIQTLEVK